MLTVLQQPFAETRAVASIILAIVLTAAAAIWAFRALRNGKHRPDLEEQLRKATIAGEQTKDWWVQKHTEIVRTEVEKAIEHFMVPYFDERFNRIEAMFDGKVLSAPFSRADFMERRKRLRGSDAI